MTSIFGFLRALLSSAIHMRLHTVVFLLNKNRQVWRFSCLVVLFTFQKVDAIHVRFKLDWFFGIKRPVFLHHI